jgi:hypothetical protein
MYNKKANIGFGINARLLIRFRLDNFIVFLIDDKAYKTLNRNGKFYVDLGLSAGWGVNSVPEWKYFLTAAYIAVPVWKLHLECQPTLVISSLKSFFFNLSIAYYFQLKRK